MDKKSKHTNTGGRPEHIIDWQAFEKLCHMQCTLVEIADFFACDEKTIERRVVKQYGEGFVDTYKKLSAGGRRSLRRWQFDAAAKGNTTMLVWLGKQWLGQIDQPLPLDPDADKDNLVFKTQWGASGGTAKEEDENT